MTTAKKAANELGKLKSQGDHQDREVQQRKYNEKEAQELIGKIRDEMRSKKEAEAAEERRLAAIAVPDADVAIVAHQLDLATPAAQRLLRAANGDVAVALRRGLVA